jgi:hypothetical protein
MKFCPTCGKPVHSTSDQHGAVYLSFTNEEAERIEHRYACENERHKWIEFTDPYGGYSIIQEVF